MPTLTFTEEELEALVDACQEAADIREVDARKVRAGLPTLPGTASSSERIAANLEAYAQQFRALVTRFAGADEYVEEGAARREADADHAAGDDEALELETIDEDTARDHERARCGGIAHGCSACNAEALAQDGRL